ncbi:Ribosomal RNA small subunit methyltransferase C [Buchnera aphidicola (Cinara cuneomaculata)]|uniref:Ribosomal RNA small subunit methyltransferase C n=1 Tax=Buchnera aphidicola (Cinara cuneomaculata) TaxID=1660040 RepID=A0A451CYE9_9GAMM|nr:16S rRNA (guanine(1207)-N(2))-methyltransferase RsmC [Buchnera aphidicola]VFP78206.1 Ribosomal RNA small subunit methyltransferase C [Buchnera aphidicola (Cinara cuneomaculata)]
MNSKNTKYLKKSKEYKLLKKNFQIFNNKTTILSGLIPQDLYYPNLFKRSVIYTNDYHLYKKKSNEKKKNIIFNYSDNSKKLFKYQQLIYFWMKNKKEAKLQIIYLLTCISNNCIIYVIGKKKSGINSINKIFIKYIQFNKIDYARNCCLYHGYILKTPKFILKKFIKKYIWNNIIIYSLPGIFGYKKIDLGSKLLISTFNKNITGQILDIGSGTGIIGIAIAKKNPLIYLTLIDINNVAIWCSKKNLVKNNIQGKVLLSNIYSKIEKKYNLIVSNPPFHQNLKINLNVITKIIKNAKKYLKKKGELRIVTNSFISCDYIFNKYNIKYNILLKTNKYKIFQIIK